MINHPAIGVVPLNPPFFATGLTLFGFPRFCFWKKPGRKTTCSQAVVSESVETEYPLVI